MVILKGEKWQMKEGMKLPNQENIRTLGEILENIGREHRQTWKLKKKFKRISQEN